MLTTPSGWQKNKIKSSEKSDLAQCGDSKTQKKRQVLNHLPPQTTLGGYKRPQYEYDRENHGIESSR